MKTWIKVTAVALMAFAAPAMGQERLALGATNAQSSHYAYFAALAKIINETYPDKYQASVVETGATVDNLKRMARGQLDVGLITTSALFHANNGIKTFDGNQIASPLLWAYSLAPQNVIVRRDAGVNSLGGACGHAVWPGPARQLDRGDQPGGPLALWG